MNDAGLPIPGPVDRVLTLLQNGQTGRAVQFLESAIRDNPSAELWVLLGVIRGQQGRMEDCLSALTHAIALDPSLHEAYYNRAQAYMHLGRPKDAIAAYREVVRLSPGYAAAWNNLGYALAKAGVWGEAADCHRKALSLRPNDPEILLNLGNALAGMGKPDEAIASYQSAIRLRPDYADAHSNLLDLLRKSGSVDEALTACDAAQRILPREPKLYICRGMILKQRGQAADAHQAYLHAVESDPRSAAARSVMCFNLNYFEDDPDRIFEAHLDSGKTIGGMPSAPATWNIDLAPGRRLRVGYVSGDFVSHSVTFFFEPLLSAHDRNSVETFCYSSTLKPDAVTRRLRTMASHWRDVPGWTPDAIGKAVRADGIDILVDLAGHTSPDILQVFTRKPAPIQVSWLGYPNTTGVGAIDYRLTDALADPPGDADRRHTEKLIRLPGGFLCYLPPNDAPPVYSPKRDNVMFGTFNTLAKVGEQVIAVWAQILSAVPGSKLIIKTQCLKDSGTVRRYRELFGRAGVGADRIEFRIWVPSKAGHLGQYADIDICLDTFPYNGTTTTCEALWMGVPVVCLAGNRHAARVGVSLLSQIGLPELIASDPEQYVGIATSLARDSDRREKLRSEMRDRMRASRLCDSAGFARSMEAAYRSMWHDWCAGQRSTMDNTDTA